MNIWILTAGNFNNALYFINEITNFANCSGIRVH